MSSITLDGNLTAATERDQFRVVEPKIDFATIIGNSVNVRKNAYNRAIGLTPALKQKKTKYFITSGEL